MLLKDRGRKGHSAWGQKGNSLLQETKLAEFSIHILIHTKIYINVHTHVPYLKGTMIISVEPRECKGKL